MTAGFQLAAPRNISNPSHLLSATRPLRRTRMLLMASMATTCRLIAPLCRGIPLAREPREMLLGRAGYCWAMTTSTMGPRSRGRPWMATSELGSYILDDKL